MQHSAHRHIEFNQSRETQADIWPVK